MFFSLIKDSKLIKTATQILIIYLDAVRAILHILLKLHNYLVKVLKLICTFFHFSYDNEVIQLKFWQVCDMQKNNQGHYQLPFNKTIKPFCSSRFMNKNTHKCN